MSSGVDQTPLQTLAATVHDPRWATERARERATLCLLHFIGCAVAGRDLPWSAAARATAAAALGPGGCTVIGLPEPAAPRVAIFANAVQGQSTLAEDVHTPSLVHPGSIVIPAALAAAEAHGTDGATLLDAITVGYEVACIAGEALKTPAFVERGFRPSGVFGVLGAAAATARVAGLDSERTSASLGLAVNMAAGLREWAWSGTTDVYVQNGMAAANGNFAVTLAANGFSGPSSALDGAAGMAQAFSGGAVDWERMRARLIDAPAVCEVVFKRYPACSAVQSAIQLAQTTAGRVQADGIDSVTVSTHRHGKYNPGCDNAGPWADVGQAQMSNQLGVALALHGKAMTVADYAAGTHDPAVRALAARVVVVEDPELTRAYPGRSGARLVIRTRSGETIEEAIVDGTPLSDAEAAAFATAALCGRFGDERGFELAECARACGRSRAARELTGVLRDAETDTELKANAHGGNY